MAGLVLGAGLLALLRPRPRPQVIRYGLSMPASQAPDPAWGAVPSPDGSRIAYVGAADKQLWIKDRDRYEARPLAGSYGAVNFTWSPDGEWIAFLSGREVRKLPIMGGAPVTIADSASGNTGLAWLDDGTIVYIRAGGTGFRRVPASGGGSTEIYADSGNLEKVTPLPDSRGVLFIRCSGSCVTSQELWALDLRNGTAHQVLPGIAFGQYLRTGHLMAIRRDGAMFVVPFDRKRLLTTGSPIPVVDSISVVNGVLPLVAVSANGTLVMRQGAALSLLQWYQMVWIDRTGRETDVDPSWRFRFTNYGANYGWSLSPDGTRLAIGLFTDAGDDIWVKQLPRGPLSRVSYDSASEFRPRWMPDGRSVMFGSNRQGTQGIGGLYMRRADGTGEDSLLRRAPAGIFEADWSPDRTWLLFRTGGTIGLSGGRDIVGLRPGIDSAPVPVVATRYDEEAIAISPNGRWLAYESNETGRTEIFIRPFPNTQAGKRQVSNGGGVAPLWSRNARELFYLSPTRDMMAVSVAGTDEPQLGERQTLFHLDDRIYMSNSEFYTPYDVAPDGRFIMARNVTEASKIEVPLIVVENWFEELRQKTRGQ